MPKQKEESPMIELHQRVRKELIAIDQKYPSVFGNYDKTDRNWDDEIPVEKALGVLLWRIDEEIRRLRKEGI